MTQDLGRTVSLLERTPAALDALLRGLPGEWTSAGEGPGTWNVPAIVAHLIHAEHADWIPRARMILDHGDTRPFPAFDRLGHVGESEGKTLDQLLDRFAQARRESLESLAALNLRPSDLERPGRHPAFGAVTLGQLLATWAAHDLTHLHQISRVMAHQYREAVGPWQQYLGVMHCGGHSGA